MKPKFISFGKIGQFADVVYAIKKQAQYIGLDENDKAVYDNSLKLPIVDCKMSEKIHGTNSAVCMSSEFGFYVQSKKNVITPEKDNAGCAFAVMQRKNQWLELLDQLVKWWGINISDNDVSLYFEWCGGNIQKKSALTNIEKSAMIFQYFKVSPRTINPKTEELYPAYWLSTNGVECKDSQIYNVMSYPTYTITIDFNKPHESVNEMVKLVETVIEPASPVGKAFGQEANVGEGVVATFKYKGNIHRFKVKGSGHSSSHVKKLKVVDVEKINGIINFVNEVCHASRLEQAWQNVFGINEEKLEPTKQATSDIIRAVVKDIMEEEMNNMLALDISPKEIGPHVAQVTRTWFFEQLNERIMGKETK